MKISNFPILMMACLGLALTPLQAQEDAAEDVPEVKQAAPDSTEIKPLAAPVEVTRMPRLTVKVTGLTPSTGTVEVSLFDSADNFMLKPFAQQAGDPDENGTVEVLFLNVFEGEYGLVAVHDENANGFYDAGFLGFGAEPVGYSNAAAPWLGRPSFEAVKFDVQEDLEITLEMD